MEIRASRSGGGEPPFLLIHCKICDVMLDNHSPHVLLHGKGNKSRIVPLTEETVANLKYYLSLYHKNTSFDSPLFYVTLKGSRAEMSEDNVQRILKKYGEMARKTDSTLPSIHPHLLRHSFGAINYRAGMTQPELAKLMGHSQIETTEIYAETDKEMIREAIKKANVNYSEESKWVDLTDEEKLIVLGLKRK